MSAIAKLLATTTLLIGVSGTLMAGYADDGKAPAADPALTLRSILERATEDTERTREDEVDQGVGSGTDQSDTTIDKESMSWRVPSGASPLDADPIAVEELFSGMSSADVVSVINAEIKNILDEVTRSSDENGLRTGEITINELDRLNREAARSSSSLALERTRLERAKTQLDLLMFLRETVEEIEPKKPEMKHSKPDEGESRAASLAEQEEKAEQAEEQARKDAVLRAEQEGLPRIGEVLGIGGRFQARIILPDGAELLAHNGMLTPGGYRVEEISDGGVILRGASGNRYMIAPGGGPRAAGEDQSRGRGDTRSGVGQVIDLGGAPLGVF